MESPKNKKIMMYNCESVAKNQDLPE